MPIKETIENIKSMLKEFIKEDMDAESIAKIQKSIEDCDGVLTDYSKVETELGECKTTIVRLVKTQGNDNPPKDPNDKPNPRGLEEIAKDKIGGK